MKTGLTGEVDRWSARGDAGSPWHEQIEDACGAIRVRWDRAPRVGIILGTGLGSFVEQITVEASFDYAEIPHFPATTALSHKGQLVCGIAQDVPVITMEGRFHCYEGYSLAQITLPVRVMQRLGIDTLIVSNASGGLDRRLVTGDLVAIDDHINLLEGNQTGWRDDGLFDRATKRTRPYDDRLIRWAQEIAMQHGFVVHRGVYVALTGPNYETRAEYRFLRAIGGDIVGMSTVPEVLVASELSLQILALSVVTNVCDPDNIHGTDGPSVASAAATAEPRMRSVVLGVLARLRTDDFA